MSDVLVKRLRTPVGFQDLPFIQEEAADRIEELEAKLRASALQELSALGQAQEAHQAQLEAEAKLAKAVEVLKLADKAIMENTTDQDLLMWGEPTVSHIRTAIAELTGGKDDAT